MPIYLLTLLTLISCNQLFAQQDTREYLQNLSAEEQAKFFQQASKYKFTVTELNQSAERFGVEPDSRHIQRMLSKKQVPAWQEEVLTPKIVKHVAGKKGIAYPDPAEIKKSYSSIPFDSTSVREFVRQQYLPQLKSQATKMQAPKLLSKCKESKTIKKVITSRYNQTGSAPIQDLLFIPVDFAPKDYEYNEVLGKNVSVLIYEKDKNTEIHRMAQGLGVQCLPQRFRTTGEAFFIDQGINALRNYDEDYNAPGMLHPYFKKVSLN